ncbi:MAG: hypothetical protein ACTSWN_10240 [Promethearchaeota archaeon]
MDLQNKIKKFGFIIVGIIAAIFITVAVPHWISGQFDFKLDINYIGYVILISLAFATTVHLWSRAPTFEKGTSIRKLFILMGISFITISCIFLFYISEAWSIWAGKPTITEMLDSSITDVEFNMFNLESLHVRMPLSSIVTFSFIMIGVSFYIWPLEKYVKNRRPWFTISLWVCLLIMPIFALFRNNWLMLTIATTGIISFVLINFIFMFYLYISLAANSTGKMRIASTFVAFGLILMICVWVLGIGIVSDDRLQTILQFSIGVTSMILFNAGFHIIRT